MGRRNPKRPNKEPFIRKGRTVGGWTLKQVLGRGGNGEVWEVKKEGFSNHAIKFLKKTDLDSYERFKAEVHVLSTVSVDGLIKIQSYNLPNNIKGSTPWFLMPKAEVCFEYLKDKSPLEIVENFIKLSETLSNLHELDISHRDIKPANILVLNDRLCFADFGLVKYPGKTDVTDSRRDLGAKYTMAPEMRRMPEQHDGKAADVYSLAKSLWILIAKLPKGFDGQYVSSSGLSIKKYCEGMYTTSLENLLSKSTDNDFLNRPSAREFMEELIAWKRLNSDMHSRGVQEWIDLHNVIFPSGAPTRASWEDVDSICSILNEVGKVGSLNHMFYPNGGGMDMLGASKAREKGMINLHTGGSVDIVKPKKLLYESFDFDHHWNYFRLELEEIQPIVESYKGAEYLLEIEPGKYVNRSCWEEGEYDGKELPEFARPITRYTRGSLVIFGKRSIYNLASGKLDAYDGRHNKMNAEEFRGHIEEFASQCAKAGIDVSQM